MKNSYHAMYYRGYDARESGKGKECLPVFLDGIEKGYWLAGWHDCDMDMESTKQGNPDPEE